MVVDIKMVNEKIKKINTEIAINNESVEAEMTGMPKRRGIMGSIKGMFR